MSPDFDPNIDTAPEGLQSLELEPPPGAFDRFKRRAALLQETRYVLERQVYGFWIVLHSLLNLIFKKVRVPVSPPNAKYARRYRSAIENTTRGRS